MVSEEDIKKVLLEWEERRLPKVIERDVKVNLNPTQIITITGVRRAGKTYLLYKIIEKLLKKFKKIFSIIGFSDAERKSSSASPEDRIQFALWTYLIA